MKAFVVAALAFTTHATGDATRSSANSSRTPSVAVLSVGLVRTMLHPQLTPSFALMTSSLAAARLPHALFVFASVAGEADTGEKRIASLRARIEAAYHPRRVWLSKEDLKCVNCVGVDCRKQAKNDAFSILRQFHKLHLAYRALRDYEAASAQPPFDWVLKVRPDLVWFEPLPLASINTTAAIATGRGGARVYVPHGVMSRRPEMQLHNDHVFLCPREACGPYFDRLITNYGACRGNVNKEAFFEEAYGGRTGMIEVAYTIARESGPECERMVCSGNRISTGCTAPHLTKYVGACNKIRERWKQNAGNQPPSPGRVSSRRPSRVGGGGG